MKSDVRLSIVTSLYRTSKYLDEFYRRTVAAASALTDAFEVILVNDGSPDDSMARALRLHEQDSRVRIIDLSRNFGHHKALMTGLAHARGHLVFLIDSDLEEAPEWLLPFHDALLRSDVDVVYGVQRTRKGGWLERTTGAIFFRVISPLLTHRIPANVVTARLMSRRYVQALVQHRDRELCLSGVWVATGFEQQALGVDKGTRGETSYSMRRRISEFVSAVTSFSNRPLIFVFYLGTVVMIGSLVAAVGLIIQTLNHGIGVPGYASLMVSIWFLGGLMIFSIGIVGVYVAKVFTEVKDRPYTVIRAEYGGAESHDNPTNPRTGSTVLRG